MTHTSSSRASRPAVAGETTDATRAMDSLRRIVHALRVATRSSERAFGMSAAQLFVLRQLALAPKQSLSDLARRTRTTQSSISEVVARLIARGLVVREPSADDRRRAELSLTPSAHTLLASAPETLQERLLRAFDELDGNQRQALAEGMEAWFTRAGLERVAAPFFFEPRERARKNPPQSTG